ncbi:multidrug efflux MFS transporter [Paenibacillus antri]|uniref:Multidrug efflux MFS transporter n=1 Tax=Paenibacillus antri TaxID=2582848 RepID=A0A5R9GCW5_9BACL|nr:MFS transporter [Paenibacillus antri]TLS54317.1 multidrug efflux MFS transporter [Paenibacillus antri]
MERWKINLAVLWFGQFLVMSGMSMIMPFISLYVQEELGVSDPAQVAWWANAIFASNFITSFIAQPLWGGLADRYGRKIMLLRSGFGMAIVMLLMGFATSAWQLLALRMLNGVISGYVPAATALMSASAPKERMGFAMGTLQSGAVAGTILGPFIGGVLAEWVGYRPIFYITGSLLLLASLLAWAVVKENFVRDGSSRKGAAVSLGDSFRRLIKAPQIPALFAVTVGIQVAMLSSLLLIPLFVQELHGTVRLAFYAGLVGSITGFANMAASPLLGRFADRVGYEKVLTVCLIGAALSFIPQAFVDNIWQLIASRFLLGLFMGGMLPSVNALLRVYTPDGMESRAFGFNSSFLSLGNILGPMIGGALAGWIGIRGIFFFACVMLLTNAAWTWVTLRKKRGSSAPG